MSLYCFSNFSDLLHKRSSKIEVHSMGIDYHELFWRILNRKKRDSCCFGSSKNRFLVFGRKNSLSKLIKSTPRKYPRFTIFMKIKALKKTPFKTIKIMKCSFPIFRNYRFLHKHNIKIMEHSLKIILKHIGKTLMNIPYKNINGSIYFRIIWFSEIFNFCIIDCHKTCNWTRAFYHVFR